jgi:hypothetical protein
MFSQADFLYSSVLLQLTASASEFCSLNAARTRIAENTSCDRYPLLCDVTARALPSNGPCADTKKTLLQYCWPRVCCGRCLAVGRYVTISCIITILFWGPIWMPSIFWAWMFIFTGHQPMTDSLKHKIWIKSVQLFWHWLGIHPYIYIPAAFEK